MFKKFLPLLLVFAMVFGLLPPSTGLIEANTSQNFYFPNESYSPNSARVVTDERVTISGTINNVNGGNITYSIYQVTDTKGNTDPKDDTIGQSRENINSNIFLNGSDITVYNIQLFPGLNRITFTGTQGFSQVTDTIYIEYRNGPVLYNLSVNLDGNGYLMKERDSTIVYSGPSKGKAEANVSITGNAPNAEKVTVLVNGKSWSYPVTNANNWAFFASPITLKKGKNLVTIKVQNQTQVVETTREVVFYNGSVTFYDMNLYEDKNGNDQIDVHVLPPDDEVASPLEYHPNYAATDITKMKVKGRVIVPNAYYGTPAAPHPDPNAVDLVSELNLTYRLDNGPWDVTNLTAKQINSVEFSYKATDPFFVFEVNINGFSGLNFDQRYYLDLLANNEENIYLQQGAQQEGTDAGELNFTLRDANQAYIYDINYLPGYTATTPPASYSSLGSTDMENIHIFSVPVGVEILIGNPDKIAGSPFPDDLVKITEVIDASGKQYTDADNPVRFKYEQKLPNSGEPQPYVYQTVNGVQEKFLRVIMEISELPTSGTQTIKFQLNHTTYPAAADIKPVTVTLVYGPYVKFAKLYDGMKIDDDTTLSTRKTVIMDALQNFAGELINVANPNELKYDEPKQTVFLYINNVLIPLEQDGSPLKFKVPVDTGDPNDAYDKAFSALRNGENTIKFVLQTDKNNYQKELKIYLVPTNLPVIPVSGTDGVFPYSTNYNEPKPNDPNFELQGSVYLTKQSRMHIHGTFDFIDLGTNNIQDRVDAISGKDNYILKIVSAGKNDMIWNLGNTFRTDKGSTINPTNPHLHQGKLEVTYHTDKQYFSFILFNEDIPGDGSPVVYNIFVYNNGESGPRASYRLEVNPTSIPYTVVRPLLPAKKIVNQNFVEVIIHSTGADKVTVNKQEGEKINFDSDNDGTVDYAGAFRVIVKDLKPNKDNKITFTIERGNDKISDSINVFYAPTNIPGAQYMEAMDSRHKVFEGQLNLTFPKGTTLTRVDYNIPEQLKNQVFTGHDILFAIANPEDGVVDRREFETLPANFDRILQGFGVRFRASFPNRFTKASPVYWIDAGMADNPNTSVYDPLKHGADPYQFPNSGIPVYDERPAERELRPSKRGELVLSFDPNIRQGAGTLVTAFRYDAENKYWENIGGIVDEKKNTITVPFDRFGYYVVGKLGYSFTDVTMHPYARNEVEAIYVKGVMNAANSGEFGTDQYVTRGEFTRMIVKALGIPLNYEMSQPHFDDVPYIVNPDALWDYRYIETAAREGIVRGTLPRVFEPNSRLTREQAAVILARAINLKLETNRSKIDKDLQKQFKDYTEFGYYAAPSIAAIAKKGFIKGSPVDPSDPKKGYVFEPQANLLRADAAIIMSRVMADQKRLPKLN